MVNYSELKVTDPLAFVFERVHQKWIGYFISISAVVATTSVLLVFQLGQPRIWMSMSRDGLLPKAFGKIHPKYRTPWFSTIVTGFLVAIPTLFMESSLMTELTSIGTLFAFVLVSGGVLLLPRISNTGKKGFHLPYFNGRYVVPVLFLLFVYLFRSRLGDALQNFSHDGLQEILFLVFTVLAGLLAGATFIKKYSLIPILGVLFCAYLLIEIRAVAWEWFFGWMGIGLTIYFLYGYRKSRLSANNERANSPSQNPR
jgi:amino acid transporter